MPPLFSLCGALLIFYGLRMIYPPAAFIFAGVLNFLLAMGLAQDLKPKSK